MPQNVTLDGNRVFTEVIKLNDQVLRLGTRLTRMTAHVLAECPISVSIKICSKEYLINYLHE